jgi:glycosyltransferase involved in cell wall biosynthesis
VNAAGGPSLLSVLRRLGRLHDGEVDKERWATRPGGTARPVRVALDATAVPARPAGAGRYVVSLAAALAASAGRAGAPGGLDLTLLARVGDGRRWQDLAPGARVRAVAPSARPARLLWEQLALPRLLARDAVDVHHGPHYTMPERARVPRVVTIHDLTFFDHPEWHEGAKVRVFRRAIRVAARKADALVCVSAVTAARLDALLAPAAPVHVIPHGVDHERFRPVEALPDPVATADREALARLGARPPYVAFVGTVEPRKGVPTLVEAFDRVAGHPSGRDLSLVVAGGEGWDGGATTRAIAAARHRDRIVRTGYVGEAAVAALLRHAAVVAYPSMGEGFGLPALEALACGAPLVTTAGSAMEEVAGDAAVLVPPGDAGALADAVEAVVAGGEATADRRRGGLEVAARFTWEASASAHLAVYRGVAR